MIEELVKYAKGLDANGLTINWIKKNKNTFENKNQSEVEHIIDFLIHKNYLNLDWSSYDLLKKKSKKWLKQLSQNVSTIDEEYGIDIKIVLDFEDGFRFVKLISESSYRKEGALMSHCVSSYYGKDKEIFSLRDEFNKPHCTIEKDMQIKGKGNGDIHPKYINYVVKFLEWTGMKVRDYEMENLGYKKIPFSKFCVNKLYRDRYLKEEIEVKYNDEIIVFDDWNLLLKYKGNKIKGYNKDLYLSNTEIEELPENLHVEGSLNLNNTKIKELPENLCVNGSLNLSYSEIKELPENLHVEGVLDLSYSEIKELPENLYVEGFLNLSYSEIKKLPENFTVDSNLYLSNSQITHLPDNFTVNGSLDLSFSKIEELPENLYVNGYLDLSYSEIKELPENLFVGGKIIR